MRYIGIDYSLTSPSICISEEDPAEIKFENCQFYYLTDLKKCVGKFGNLKGQLHKPYSCDEERYVNICEWVLQYLKVHDNITIEGYSLNSKTGRIFNIAENTGILKHYLWQEKYPFATTPPTVVKKFATGKGNANKEKLQEVFLQETNVDIKKILSLTMKQWNPSSDIIDSFYISKVGFHESKNRS